jgi:hypothetical protein
MAYDRWCCDIGLYRPAGSSSENLIQQVSLFFLRICLIYLTKALFMKAGNKNITREFLRFFEIALFFAVSVLGYSLLAKTSSFSSKSKSRTDTVRIQKTPEQSGFERELFVQSCILGIPAYRDISASRHGLVDFSVDEGFYVGHPLAFHGVPLLLSCTALNSRPLRPYNLFQQNPVLLT